MLSSQPAKKKGKRKREENSDTEEEVGKDDDDDAVISSLKKPRIKIKISQVEKKTIQKRRKKGADEIEEGDAVNEEIPDSSKKRRKLEKIPENEVVAKKKKSAKKAESELGATRASSETMGSVSKENDEISEDTGRDISSDDPLMDPDGMKKERQALGKGYKMAKAFFRKRGPWTLPAEVGDNRFVDVANLTLAKMAKYDKFDVFTEAVTEEEAPGYYEIVKKPMDFSKMKTKIEDGSYGTGSKAAAAFYEDFFLVFENCHLYNDEEGEVVEEAARIFALVPETYAFACATVGGKRKNIKSLKS